MVVAQGARLVLMDGLERRGQMKVTASEGREGEVPLGGAGETVGRAIGAWVVGGCGASPEPGKDDGDSAADCFTRGEEGALREEQDGLLAGGLPLRDMRALEVKLSGAGWRGDIGADQSSCRF